MRADDKDRRRAAEQAVRDAAKRGADEAWVATELLEGAQTLAEAISARCPIPLEQAAHLIEVVGEAPVEAAQIGVVYRDRAPKNNLFPGEYPEVPEGGAVWVFALE
jgi:hypothetical protein